MAMLVWAGQCETVVAQIPASIAAEVKDDEIDPDQRFSNAQGTDGTNNFVATSGDTTVDVTNWKLSTLSVTPPTNSGDDFILNITATATEAENLDQNQNTDSITVVVTSIAAAMAFTHG